MKAIIMFGLTLLAKTPRAVFLALVFHDAVYNRRFVRSVFRRRGA